MKKKSSLLDRLGNYLCTLGTSQDGAVALIAPLAILALVFSMLLALTLSIVPPIEEAVSALGLSDSMQDYIDTVKNGILWAWIISGGIMLWHRYRGAINAIQVTIPACFYLTVALTFLGKLYYDLTNDQIETEGLGLVIYIVSMIGLFVIFSIISALATVIGVPLAISAAVVVGVCIDLLVNYIYGESVKSTPCYQALKEAIKEINLKKDILEVQLIDTGVYFVNPAAKIVSRVHFSKYEFKSLNLWTRKPFLSLVMKLLPSGYKLESLDDMWVATNSKLLAKVTEQDRKSGMGNWVKSK